MMKNITIDQARQLWGGNPEWDQQAKVIGVRGGLEPVGTPDQFIDYDDIFFQIIGTSVTSFKGSVDPGENYIKNPINVDGCAQLVCGLWHFQLGLHTGTYPAFVEAEDFTVNRLSIGGIVIGQQTGDYGINLHSGGSGDENLFSAGCQVIYNSTGYFGAGAEWDDFYLPLRDALVQNNQALLPYLLIDGRGYE